MWGERSTRSRRYGGHLGLARVTNRVRSDSGRDAAREYRGRAGVACKCRGGAGADGFSRNVALDERCARIDPCWSCGPRRFQCRALIDTGGRNRRGGVSRIVRRAVRLALLSRCQAGGLAPRANRRRAADGEDGHEDQGAVHHSSIGVKTTQRSRPWPPAPPSARDRVRRRD